jgi:hypothetical protein
MRRFFNGSQFLITLKKSYKQIKALLSDLIFCMYVCMYVCMHACMHVVVSRNTIFLKHVKVLRQAVRFFINLINTFYELRNLEMGLKKFLCHHMYSSNTKSFIFIYRSETELT